MYPHNAVRAKAACIAYPVSCLRDNWEQTVFFFCLESEKQVGHIRHGFFIAAWQVTVPEKKRSPELVTAPVIKTGRPLLRAARKLSAAREAVHAVCAWGSVRTSRIQAAPAIRHREMVGDRGKDARVVTKVAVG